MNLHSITIVYSLPIDVERNIFVPPLGLRYDYVCVYYSRIFQKIKL